MYFSVNYGGCFLENSKHLLKLDAFLENLVGLQILSLFRLELKSLKVWVQHFTIGFIKNHMAMARNKFMITWLEAIMSINNNSTQDKTHTVTRFSLLIPKFKHFFIAWESFVCLPLTFSRVAWLNVG
jgi:hypothetical protein